MANPNIVSLTTLNYDIDLKGLTTTNSTIVSEVAASNVQVVDNLFITSIVAGTVSVTINHGTTALFNSIQVTGFTTEQIKGPIVLKETQYLTGNASANSSINVTAHKRTMA